MYEASVPPYEVILVDDGSIDGTQNMIQSLKAENIICLTHKKNQGKGAAIRTALPHVSGDVVVIQDADLEYSPAEYDRLIEPILKNKADVVFGSRFIGNDPHRAIYFWNRLANSFLTIFSNICTNMNLTDIETGYKMFRASLIKDINIEENRFGVEPELTAKFASLNCRIYEVGISYSGRSYAEGKKIKFKDGLRALYAIVKYNFFRS